MSNVYDEFNIPDDQSSGQSEGGQLRTKLEAAIKLLKEKDKQITELQQFRTQSEVSSLLKDIPEKFHKLAQKELADNPTAEGLTAFVAEYGDLWGAEQSTEQNSEDRAMQAAIDKIAAAQREARNTSDEQFKMPSQAELQRMSFADAVKAAEAAKAAGYKGPFS